VTALLVLGGGLCFFVWAVIVSDPFGVFFFILGVPFLQCPVMGFGAGMSLETKSLGEESPPEETESDVVIRALLLRR